MAAAALLELDAYLDGTVGITNLNVHAAINTQGLVAIDDFATLEESGIYQMCANLRWPGGMVNVANPAFDPNNPVPGVPQNLMVNNPGYPIGHIQVKRLKLLRYYVAHLKRTNTMSLCSC
jgi:hypothetical protein